MVTPISDSQYYDASKGRVSAPLLLENDAAGDTGSETWVRAIPMPGRGMMASVLSVVILDRDGVTVVDPGWPGRDMQHDVFGPLDGFLRVHGRRLGDITSVVATHAHPDHIGAAGPLAEITGAQLVVGAVEQHSIDAERSGTGVGNFVVNSSSVRAPAGALESSVSDRQGTAAADYLPRQQPDRLLEHGGRLGHLEAVLTPGHTPGHLCLVDREAHVLLAADQILPEIHPGIGLGVGEFGGNPVESYLSSLDQLGEFDDYRIVPGHGYAFTGLRPRRLETAEHVLTRAHEVARVLEWNPEVGVWDLASQLDWSGGWGKLQKSPLLVSGLKQTMMYRDLVLSGGLAPWDRVFG